MNVSISASFSGTTPLVMLAILALSMS